MIKQLPTCTSIGHGRPVSHMTYDTARDCCCIATEMSLTASGKTTRFVKQINKLFVYMYNTINFLLCSNFSFVVLLTCSAPTASWAWHYEVHWWGSVCRRVCPGSYPWRGRDDLLFTSQIQRQMEQWNGLVST